MRKLKVNLDDLASAFESSFDDLSYYLDLQTGQVIAVSDETRRELEEIYEETGFIEGEEPLVLADLLAERGLPEWQRQALLEADAVEAGYGERFISVPLVDSHEAYRDMEDFIGSVRNPHLRELLEVAISGRGAFRRFKDVLLRYPAERERWFEFKDVRMEKRVREWLADHDIEPSE